MLDHKDESHDPGSQRAHIKGYDLYKWENIKAHRARMIIQG